MNLDWGVQLLPLGLVNSILAITTLSVGYKQLNFVLCFYGSYLCNWPVETSIRGAWCVMPPILGGVPPHLHTIIIILKNQNYYWVQKVSETYGNALKLYTVGLPGFFFYHTLFHFTMNGSMPHFYGFSHMQIVFYSAVWWSVWQQQEKH